MSGLYHPAEHADISGKSSTALQAEQTDGNGDSQLEEVGSPYHSCRGCDVVGQVTGLEQTVGNRNVELKYTFCCYLIHGRKTK